MNITKFPQWVNPPFVLVRWEKARPGLCFSIVKFNENMTNRLYNYSDGSITWRCYLIEEGSYLSCLKGVQILTASYEKIIYNI